jgi:hypothetical protein
MAAAAMVWEPGHTSGEEIQREGAPPGIETEIKTEQDMEMILALDPASSEEMSGQDTLPGVEGMVEIEPDSDMEIALGSGPANDSEGRGLNAPFSEDQVQAQQQDVETDEDEEDQVERLLETQEAEPAIGTQSPQLLRAQRMDSQM